MPAATSQTSISSLAVPATQNTAPVHEYNCLYTHDIRRKSKRWQDGFLRFHTFNKRVMVYDVSRNFVGDTHWRVDDPLQEGDEVTLDRGGVQVQVADQIGETETDLTELRNSKNKAVESPRPASPLRVPGGGVGKAIQHGSLHPGHRPSGLTSSRPPLHDKHRSLNAMLGNARPPIGKAVLIESPFETRRRQQEYDEAHEERTSKRQKVGTLRRQPDVSIMGSRKASTRRPDGDESPQQRPSVIDISSSEVNPGDIQTAPSPSLAPTTITSQRVASKPSQKRRSTARGSDAPHKSMVELANPCGLTNIQGTKLSIKPSGARRKMLTCVPEKGDDSTFKPQDQQRKLQARLARLAERSAHRNRELPKPNVSTHEVPGHSVSAKRSDLEVITLDTQVTSETFPGTDADLHLDDRPSHGAANLEPGIVQSDKHEGEIHDLYGTRAVPTLSTEPARQETAHTIPSPTVITQMHTPPDLATQAYIFPSTIDIDRVFGSQSELHDTGDDTIEGNFQDEQQKAVLVDAPRPEAALGQVMEQCNRSASPAMPLAADRSKRPVQDPWSREAFDLFKWRPPDWDEERWCVVAASS